MADVSLNINERNYIIGCDDGQENRVQELGAYIDHKTKDLKATGANGSESHMLMLASLVMADEIFELKDNLNRLNSAYSQLNRDSMSERDEQIITEAIHHLAQRIDSISERLHKP